MRVDIPRNAISWRAEPDIDAALRRAIADGLSAGEAAARLNAQFHRGITRCACIGRARRLGLRFRGRRVEFQKEVTP